MIGEATGPEMIPISLNNGHYVFFSSQVRRQKMSWSPAGNSGDNRTDWSLSLVYISSCFTEDNAENDKTRDLTNNHTNMASYDKTTGPLRLANDGAE